MAGRLVRTIGIFEQFRGAKNRELEQTLEQHNKVQKQLYVAPLPIFSLEDSTR